MSQKNRDYITINDTNYNLQDIESLAWKKLVNGSVKKKNGFRNMCVGTTDEKNSVSQRMVVNRKVDELKKIIYFHTDNRSRKFIHLQLDNRISLLFYDARQRIQIVAKSRATINADISFTQDRWKATNSHARLGYMTTEPPNTKLDQPGFGYDERFSITKPTDNDSNPFEKNFAVVSCTVYELEFLYLDFHGNRKAIFYYEKNQVQSSFWAVP